MSLPQLTVRGLRVQPVLVPLDPPAETASGGVPAAPLVLIDLLTEEGVSGHAYLFCYTPLVLGPMAQLLSNLEPVLKGAVLAPRSIERALQGRFRLLGHQGLSGMAMAGIDMAAWDALAHAAGLPLARLLGGEIQPIPAYASLRTMGQNRAAAEAEAALASGGFAAVKVKVGHASVAEDLAVIRAIRSAVGAEVRIMVDYNQSLSVPDALERGRALEAEGLAWIEEPTHHEDDLGSAAIARALDTPIQLGENWWGTRAMARSLQAGASDHVMPDVMKIGGVSGWLRAAALAEPGGLPVSSHLFPEFSAHLLAVTPTAHLLEHLDFASPILAEPLRIERGFALPAATPGSGIGWSDAAVQRYRI
jgi:mandelate racemase